MSYKHEQRITYYCDTPGCAARLIVTDKYLADANNVMRGKGWGRFLRGLNGGKDYVVKHYCPLCMMAKKKGGGESVKTSYQIRLRGCDASTRIKMELTPEEKALVDRIAEATKAASEYDCMPTLHVESPTASDDDE